MEGSAVMERHYIRAPQEAAGDDHVRVVEWIVSDGAEVAARAAIALAETTKAAFEIESDGAGFLFHLVAAGDRVKVGEPIAVVAPDRVRPAGLTAAAAEAAAPEASDQTVTKGAAALVDEHHIDLSAFAGLTVVRRSDVEAYLASHETHDGPVARFFGSEALDLSAGWDEVLASADLASLQALLTALRRRLKARFNRHVPLGTLLHDRWQVAGEYGFGEGTSVYDECLILGDVTVGKHCWVGPFTVLDGNYAAVRVGDYTSIGSGCHVYSHHAIDNIITRGQAATYAADTTIGEACFISPMAIIGPGSTIGDQSFVASGSFVQGVFPARSYLAGNPATRVGRVDIRHNRVFLLKED